MGRFCDRVAQWLLPRFDLEDSCDKGWEQEGGLDPNQRKLLALLMRNPDRIPEIQVTALETLLGIEPSPPNSWVSPFAKGPSQAPQGRLRPPSGSNPAPGSEMVGALSLRRLFQRFVLHWACISTAGGFLCPLCLSSTLRP